MNMNLQKRRQGWGAALLGRLSWSRRPARSRRTVLGLDSLEDRLAPAVAGNLYIVGTTLVYNGNFADNNTTVTETSPTTALTISDTAGTITSSVPGFSGGGTGSVTGIVPSFIQTIAIQGQNGTDVINLAGLDTSRNVIAEGTTVNVSAPLVAQNVTLSGTLVSLTGTGSITTNGAGPIAGSVTVNGTLDVTTTVSAGGVSTALAHPTINTTSTIDGNVTFNGLVVGTQNLVVDAGTTGNVTAAQAINLGGTAGLAISGATSTAIGANNVNLHQIVDGSLGTFVNASNAVNLNGNLVSTGPVTLSANQDDSGPQGYTQVSGNITTTATTGGFASGALASSAVDIFVNSFPTTATSGTGTGSAKINGISVGSGGNVFITTNDSWAGLSPHGGGGPIVSNNTTGALNVSAGAAGGLYAVSGAGGLSLNTSVGNVEAGDLSAAPASGNVSIRNTGVPLTIVGTVGIPTGAANGNLSISNDNALAVAAGILVAVGGSGHSLTLATTNPISANGTLTLNVGAVIGQPGDTVNFDTTGAIVEAAGNPGATVYANNLNIVTGSGTTTPAGDIGTTGHPLLVASAVPSVPITTTPITVNVTTTVATTNGVNIAALSPMTVTGATAQSGAINLQALTNLIVSGNVANNDGSTISLFSGFDLTLNPGSSVTSASGAVVLAPGILAGTTTGNLTVASGATLATGGIIEVNPTTVPNLASATANVDISGTLAATFAVTINGTDATAAAFTLGISGTVSASARVTIDTHLDTGVQVLNLGGSIVSGGDTLINTGGSAADGVIVTTTGAINTTGNVTITPLTGTNVTMNLGGTITSNGTVAFATAAGNAPATVVITNSGSISGATAVNINDASGTGTLVLSNTGPITGGTITITGSDHAANVLSLGGSLTATAGAITITTAADTAAGSEVTLTGKTSGTASTVIDGSSTRADFVVVSPSTTTAIAFAFGSGANTLQINTAIGNIASAPAAGGTITFTAASGFQGWTTTGTVTVTPTVP